MTITTKYTLNDRVLIEKGKIRTIIGVKVSWWSFMDEPKIVYAFSGYFEGDLPEDKIIKKLE